MKVSINKNITPVKFKPYSVTFHIATREESRFFHDNIAIKACRGHGEFIGEVYRSSRGEGDYSTEHKISINNK